MSTNVVRTLLSSAALAVVATVGSVSNVSAIIYRGDFDPPFYSGQAFFEVPVSCIVSDGLILAGTGECGEVDLISAVVGTPAVPPYTDTLLFGPASNVASSLFWEAGELLGVSTLHLGPVSQEGAPFNCLDSPYSGCYLQFTMGSGGSPREVVLSRGICFEGCEFVTFEDGIATQERFTRVPEPGSLALILGALGAGWLSRRRFASN